MRRLALIAAVALATSACGVHPATGVAARATAVSAQAASARATVTAASQTNSATSVESILLTFTQGKQAHAVAVAMNPAAEGEWATIRTLELDGAAVSPKSPAFAALLRTLEDAQLAKDVDFQASWTLNVLVAVMGDAAPAAANGWAVQALDFGGGDSMGRLKATVTRGAETHQIVVTITDLGGLPMDALRNVTLDGKVVAKADRAGLAAVRRLLDGAATAPGMDAHGLRTVVALLRQEKWNF